MNTDRLTPALVRLVYSVLDDEAPLREWQDAAVALATHWRQSGYAPEDVLGILIGVQPAPWKRVRCFLPKHRGRTWGQIVIDDPTYVLWMRDNCRDPAVREFLDAVAVAAGLTGPGAPPRKRYQAIEEERDEIRAARKYRKPHKGTLELNEGAAAERELDESQPDKE